MANIELLSVTYSLPS